MKRRTFLGLGAAAAGATTLVAEKTFSQTIRTKPARIIVLGAGFSGLSAALKLHDAKVDFVVLSGWGNRTKRCKNSANALILNS